MSSIIATSKVFASEISGFNKLVSADQVDIMSSINELVDKVKQLEEHVYKVQNLANIDISGVSEGDVLSWDSADKKWVVASLE